MSLISTENMSRRFSDYDVALQLRHSSEGLQLQRDFIDDGLQVVQDQSDLEAVPIEQLRSQNPQVVHGGEKEVDMEKESVSLTELSLSKPGFLRSAKLKWLSILACVTLIVVIATALGVMESRKASISPSPAMPNAMNGTRLATVRPNPGITDDVWLFYQDSFANIQYSRFFANDSWQPSGSLGVQDCMNGSSLSAIYYAGTNLFNPLTLGENSVTPVYCQIFYFNTAGVLSSSRTTVNAPVAMIWEPMNLTVSGLPTSILPASTLFTFYENFTSPYGTVHIFAEGSDGLIQEYTSALSKEDNPGPWNTASNFPNTSGRSSIAGSLGATNMTLSLTNNDNQLEVWQKDLAINSTDNTTLQSNSWTQVFYNYIPYQPTNNSSVVECNSIYFQDIDNNFYGAQPLPREIIGTFGPASNSPPNSSIPSNATWTLTQKFLVAGALPGSSVACAQIIGHDELDSWSDRVFVQDNTTAIIEYSRNTFDSPWNITRLTN